MSIVEGKDQVFSALEKGMKSLLPGDKKLIVVECNDAFGAYDDSLLVKIPESELSDNPQIGDFYNMALEDGSKIRMKVQAKRKEHYLLDGNHPLAGFDLLFEVTIKDRRKASSSEIKTGKAQRA